MSALKDLGKIISDLPNSSKVLLGLVSATINYSGFWDGSQMGNKLLRTKAH